MKTCDNMGVIFKALVGSHAYGTNVEGSDKDYKGIYIQSPEDVLENGYVGQIDISKDETYYELGRFVDLCCGNNPTMLELLYIPEDCIVYKHPVFDLLISERDEILSKSAKAAFGGYAFSQIQKAGGLDKKMNWEKERRERKTVLDFCWVIDTADEASEPIGGIPENYGTISLRKYLDVYGLDQSELGLSALDHFRYTYNVFWGNRDRFKGIVQDEDTSNDISLSDIPKHHPRCAILYFNKDAYSKHCREYGEYQHWLKNRNTQRYVDVEGHGQQIDGKNLMHCVRLLRMASEIAICKELYVRRKDAEYLKDIRHGKYDLNKILEDCKSNIAQLDQDFDESDLPDKVDREYFKWIVKTMRKQYRDGKTKDD